MFMTTPALGPAICWMPSKQGSCYSAMLCYLIVYHSIIHIYNTGIQYITLKRELEHRIPRLHVYIVPQTPGGFRRFL